MEEQHGQQETSSDDAGSKPIVSAASLQTQQEDCSQSSEAYKQTRQTAEYGAIERRWRELRSASIDRQIELFFGMIIVAFAGLQLYNSYGTSEQTDRLISASQRNERAATKFATSAQGINEGINDAVKKLQAQADEAKRSADGTVKAANVADRTLHVSERAYVYPGSVIFDSQSSEIVIGWINSGHIPSGKLDCTIFRALVKIPESAYMSTSETPLLIEKANWSTARIPAVSVGNPFLLRIAFREIDESSFNAGHQGLIVGGTFSYNDGFSNTLQPVNRFCVKSHFDPKSKSVLVVMCDISSDLDSLIASTGYPSEQNKEQ